MRVRISANPPLPPVRAWFPLNLGSVHSAVGLNVSNFKSTLCLSVPAFRGLAPAELRLSIDGFELLDNSELSALRDGDLISVDMVSTGARDQSVSQGIQNSLRPKVSRKRKRSMSSSSPSDESDTGSESASGSESESETDTDADTEESDSGSGSGSDEFSRPTTPSVPKAASPRAHARATPSLQAPSRVVHPSTLVPPGYGKPQTRSRNLRRRLKRMHEREAAEVSPGRPVSGANAVVEGEDGGVQATTLAVPDANRGAGTIPALMSLSLRNKNKAKNFRALVGRALPPKIVFGDQEGDTSVSVSDAIATPECSTPAGGPCKPRVMPRLVPPSSRPSLPPNVFVTSIDVEAGLRRERRKERMRVEYGDELEEQPECDTGDVPPGVEPEVDVDGLEAIADKQWDTLERLTREKPMRAGMVVGFKGLGINPATYTPEQVVTVWRVVSCEGEVVVRALRGVSFGGPVDPGVAEETRHTRAELERADWRVIE